MADYSLSVNITANDKASAVFDKIKGNVNTFKNDLESAGQSMQNVGNKMSSAGSTLTKSVTVPVLGLGTAAVKTTADFDSSMSKVAAISGATGKDFDALRAKAREMGSQTKFSASESAQAMTYMAMAGWKTEEMLGGISGIMNLAAASGEDLATTSDIVTDALTAFGLSAQDSGRFADVLAAASNSANTNVSMLGESFKYCAPVAGAMGYSVEDVSIALGLMANSGIKASSSGTALRTLFTNMAKPTDQMAAAMDTLNVSLDDGNGNMFSFMQVMEQLRSGFGNLKISEEELVGGLAELEAQLAAGEISEADFDIASQKLMESAYGAEGALKAQAAAALAGKTGMSGLLAIVNASDSDFANLTNAIYNSEGTCQTMADTMQNNLNGQMTILKSQLEELAISFGDLMVPAIREAVTVIQGMVDKFNSLDDGTKKTIITIAGVAAAVGPILLIGGKLITGIGKITSGIGSVVGLFGKLGGSAASAAAPMASAGGAMGTLSSNALGLVAAGAGILLAAAGLALLAQSAIAISQAGAPAAIAMGAMVAVIALLAVGAAALAPALTAGAVGLIAFGAAIALVGVGVLAASAGMTLLATQLPTISEYGLSASVAIVALAGAMTVYAGGATLAGGASAVLAAGLVVLAAGLVAVGVGATGAAVGITLMGAGVLVLSAGVLVLSAGILALGAGLVVCGAGLVLIGNNAKTAAVGFTALTVACTAAFIPITGGAVSTAALDVALVALVATLALSTAGAVALDVAMLALSAEMVVIATSAKSAATDLQTMVTAVDVVETGLSSLKSTAEKAVKDFVSAFSGGIPNAKSTASQLATGVTTSISTGLTPIPNNTNNVLTQMNQMLTQQMTTAQRTVKTAISQMEAAFRSAKFQFNQHIALPHFSMSGEFNAKTGATPTVNVQWYKKAYDTAMMFSSPTVFGASGFGDGAGNEVVTGDEHLIDLMREAFADMNGGGGDIVIPVYVGQEYIDEMVVTAKQRNDFRSGGR